MEIYNEVVRDLLSTDNSPLRLLDDPEVSFPFLNFLVLLCVYILYFISSLEGNYSRETHRRNFEG